MYYKTSDQERVKLGFCGHECNNGMHFCGLYETSQKRDDIILAYLRQGLIDNDQVLYTPTERSVEDFRQKFSKLFPEDKALLDNNPQLTAQINAMLRIKKAEGIPAILTYRQLSETIGSSPGAPQFILNSQPIRTDYETI